MFAKALVTGATGRLGALVVERLRGVARNVTIGARSLAKVAGFPKYGFDVVYLDYDLPASWEHALMGAERLLLVPPPVDPRVDTRLVPFVQRAVAMGVGRVVLVSHVGVGHPEERALAGLEAVVRQSGAEWAIVRPNWLLQDVGPGGFLHAGLRERGVLAAPAGDGRVTFVDARDVADALVKLLTAPTCSAQIVRAVGESGLAFSAIAALIGLVGQRRVQYMPIDPDAFASRMIGAQWPAERVQLLAHRLEQIRVGEAEIFADDLVPLLGGRRGADAFFLDHADAWRVRG